MCSDIQTKHKPNLYRKSGYDPGPTDCRAVEQLTSTVKRILLPLVNKFDPKKDNLPFKIRKSLQYIARTRNLIIRKADKGSVIVVEDIDDYVKNGRQHLADNSVYLRVEGDISQALASSIKLKLKALRNAGLLNNEQFKICMPARQARIGRLYFLKKVHKIPYSIRPIVSSCGSVTENISEFVDYCLQGQVKKMTSYSRLYTKNQGYQMQCRDTVGVIRHSILIHQYTSRRGY